MTGIDKNWLESFRFQMIRLFGVDSIEEVFESDLLVKYSDLSPALAARQIGSDHNLCLVDIWTSDEILRLHRSKKYQTNSKNDNG